MSGDVRRYVEESVRAIMMLLFLVIAYIVIMVGGELYQEHQRVMNQTVQTVPERSKAELRAAHKFHGINSSKQDEKGWYFERNGKRCPLFAYQERGKK